MLLDSAVSKLWDVLSSNICIMNYSAHCPGLTLHVHVLRVAKMA